MKILELFSGYGTASFALKRLGITYEIIGYSDIDKYANKCFQQNHGGKELGNVKDIKPEELEDFDLLTGGFPCQAFSNAGKMQGELDPRGSLFYEIIRIAEVKQPKYMLLENVKGLTCKKFKDTFNKILSELDRIGYNVYWKVLNSKDYGIPQSRARVWFVCFRKDIDKGTFKFPEPVELKIFIKDILEPQVDAKYYLSPLLQERFAKYLEEKMNNGINRSVRSGGRDSLTEKHEWNIVANRYRTLDGKGECFELKKDNITNTISSVQKDNLVYAQLDSSGKAYKSQNDRIYSSDGIMTSIPSNGASNKCNVAIMNCVGTCFGRRGTSCEEKDMYNKVYSTSGQLRRLTPKECFRLMGFLNDEINLEGLSDTQRYKLAGNGQDVNMVSLIFKEMFK